MCLYSMSVLFGARPRANLECDSKQIREHLVLKDIYCATIVVAIICMSACLHLSFPSCSGRFCYCDVVLHNCTILNRAICVEG